MNDDQYQARLSQEFGANLRHLKGALGHCGGVHGDNMYLIGKLATLPEVSNIIEFGSGLSSLVFAKLQESTGKTFVSMEDHPHWAGVANKALKGLGSTYEVISTRCDPSNCPDFEQDFQVAFVDGNIFHHPGGGAGEPGENVGCPESMQKFVGRGGACLYYENVLKNAVLIWDDAEHLEEYTRKIIIELGRDPDELFWFNPTGRDSRHQLISLPEQNKEVYRQLIEEVASL